MSNPFGMDISNLYAKAMQVQSPYVDGGKVGGNGINGAGINGAHGTGAAHKVNPTQQGINEVSNIGFAKKEGFMNGLGGTNNPDDHKLFFAA